MSATTLRRRSAGGTRARWAARVLLATVSMLVQVGWLGAQTNEPPGAPESLRLEGVLEQIPPDERLRLEAGAPGVRLEGRYAGTADGRLALVTDGGMVHTRLGEIDRLWTRGRSTGKGALIGGVAGLVIGATYGALISEVTCAESSCTTLGLAAAVGGIGAAGGAAVGALVGFALPSWKLRFP
jgi:hypothetical protein